MKSDDRPIGFWSALGGVCRGTALFPELVKNSWPRVIWHLLVMTLLCSAGITWGEYRRISPAICAGELVFTDTFGPLLNNSASGFRPELDPDRARSIALPQNGRLCYTGNGINWSAPAGDELETLDYFIIWAPGGMRMFFKLEDGSWLATIWNNSAYKMVFSDFSQTLDDDSVAAAAAGLPAPCVWRGVAAQETVARIFDSTRLAMIFCLMIGNVFLLFGLSALISALFALMYRLFGVRKMRFLGVSSYWKTGIYAGFPVMMIAGCFPALALPFFSYGTVYVFGLAVYWMIAANAQEAAAERGGNGYEK